MKKIKLPIPTNDHVAVQTTLPRPVVVVIDRLAARDNRKRADWIRRELIAAVQRQEAMTSK